MNNNNNKEDNREFSSADELKEWLVNAKGVSKKKAEQAVKKLYDEGFDTANSLNGISFETLREVGLTIPVAMDLSNNLKERPLQIHPPQQEQQQLATEIITELREMKQQQQELHQQLLQQLQQQQQQQMEAHEETQAILDEDRTDKVSMSKASIGFATEFLEEEGISVPEELEVNSAGNKPFKTTFAWDNEGEAKGTDKAKKWLEVALFGEKNKSKLGIFKVSKVSLPTLKRTKKQASGKSDLAIGDLSAVEPTMEGTSAIFRVTRALIELKTDDAPLKPGQNILQLYALSTISTYGKAVCLLCTDCVNKWRVYSFSSATKLKSVKYDHGSKACEDFMQLISTNNDLQLISTTIDRQFQPAHENLMTIAEDGPDQNLEGFDLPQSDVQKFQALMDEHRYERMADKLCGIYGERPYVPSWARASETCPDYYS